MQERRLLETERGRIAVGWLIVEDLAMVLALVLLPALAGLLDSGEGGAASAAARIAARSAITLAKVAAFVAVMLIVGRRVIPWLLHYVAHTGSRELFRLAVLAIALGVAFGAAQLFGVSFALGAFFAGMILSESRAQPAGRDRERCRCATPSRCCSSSRSACCSTRRSCRASRCRCWRRWLIIVVGKSVAAFAIVRAFGYPTAHRAHHLAQPGADRRVLVHPRRPRRRARCCCPSRGRDLILAGAIISILLNPFLFAARRATGAAARRAARRPARGGDRAERADRTQRSQDHVVLVGHGRVGSFVSEALGERRDPLFVIEDDADLVAEAEDARDRGNRRQCRRPAR